MTYQLRDPRHEFTTADNKETAERWVRATWPELERAYFGARENKHATEARHQAAGIRQTEANRRTSEALRAKEDLLMRYRMQPLPDEELALFEDDIRRSEESEALANAELAAANQALGEARYTLNKVVNTMAMWANAGVKLRQKKVKLARGEPSELLKANLERKREALAETKRISGAGTPIPVIKERLAEQLNALLAQDAYRLEYDNGEPEWLHPVTHLDAEHKLPGRAVATPNLLPLLLDLFGDEIHARLAERVDEDHRGDTRLRMDPDEKQKRLKRLRSDLLDLQREECALRLLLAGSSREIAFPPDLPVEAILGVEVI
jgi:hypothetical protein